MIRGGFAVEGYTVGVLHLRSTYPLPPGNPQHAGTFDFPVCYEAVPVDDPFELMRGDPALLPELQAACERLVVRGVRVIAGACGSFAHYQTALARELPVPVYASVLTQIPLALTALGTRQLGVICASAHALDDRILSECGVTEPGRLAITEMRGHPEFDRMLAGGHPMDVRALEGELVEVTSRLLHGHQDVGALLLQCSDLAPFASALQFRWELPVYDASSLIRWLHSTVEAPVYRGLTRSVGPFVSS